MVRDAVAGTSVSVCFFPIVRENNGNIAPMRAKSGPSRGCEPHKPAAMEGISRSVRTGISSLLNGNTAPVDREPR